MAGGNCNRKELAGRLKRLKALKAHCRTQMPLVRQNAIIPSVLVVPCEFTLMKFNCTMPRD